MSIEQNKHIHFRDLGLVDYKHTWDLQEKLLNEVVALKIANRHSSVHVPTPNYLLFCQHPHVYTLGKSGDENNLLLSPEQLQQEGALFYRINRGGDITYHGPGQIVGYPILDLENFFTDIHKYLRTIEEAVILTLRDYSLDGGRIAGLTGVWLDYEEPQKARKICALGVKTSRWVTMHGFAFNVNTDLKYFDHIIPCGIQDKAVTSLAKELGGDQDLSEVSHNLLQHLCREFGMLIREHSK